MSANAGDVPQRCLIGEPADIVQSIQDYREIGVTHLNLRFSLEGMAEHEVMKSLETFTTDVLPLAAD